jgi:hypothetical protein
MIQAVRRGISVSDQKLTSRPPSLAQVNWLQAAGIAARNSASTSGMNDRLGSPRQQIWRIFVSAAVCLLELIGVGARVPRHGRPAGTRPRADSAAGATRRGVFGERGSTLPQGGAGPSP